MRTRTRNSIVLAVVGVAVSAGLVLTARHRADTPLPGSRALDAIPAGALLVATADLAALRGTGAFGALLQQGREIQGLGKVKDICGFDPIEQIETAALGIPPANDAGEFGVAAAGKFDDEALLACAAKVIQARGGRPVITPLGSFRSVHDGASASGGEIAVRRGGSMLLLGGGGYLRAMVDAAEGRVPSVHASAGHGELARAVGDGVIRLTFVLTPEQRASISQGVARGSAIAAGGLAVTIGPEVGVHGVLRCDTAEACADVARSLTVAKQERAGDLSLRVVGFGGLLDRVTIDAEGPYVHARVSVPIDEAAKLLDTALKLRGFSHPMPDATAPPSQSGAPASPSPSASASASASASGSASASAAPAPGRPAPSATSSGAPGGR